MINEERIVADFLELVQIDSHSGEEAKVVEALIPKLEEMGLEVMVDNAGEKVGGQTGNIIAKLKGTTDGEPILFCSHMDTVKPGQGVRPIVKNGTIYSDGTTVLGADNKAGIAAILEGIRVIKENNIPHGDIEVAFTIWEEGGLLGAKNLDYSQINSKYAFILDSGKSPGEIITKGPAQDMIIAKITGKLAHAGVVPEEGISAIMIAARAIDNMKLLRIDEETTANVGQIKGGGATNIVPASVEVHAEARSLDEAKLDAQTAHMTEAFEKAAADFGGSVEMKIERMYPPFKIEDDEEIIVKLKEAFKNMGIEAYTTSTGGGSDTNIFNGNGIKAVNLGIGARAVHTFEEYIHIKDLVDSAKMVSEIIKVFA
ncbi:MAG: M20/M25/M40 family metallo-hydrolase [Clostridiales bacterium]|nr:M20/M25/M40 family metallo-hydrolase [Clostridiales bacterium]